MTTTTSTRTFSPRPRDIERRWYVVDADGAVLGRLASEVAKILRGKHKPIFAPHADTGDHVVVVNAGKVRVTGGKESRKFLYRHSGFPGGLRQVDYGRLLAQRPVLAVEKAVKGMLPKTRLGRQMATKLKVYEGSEHPHEAQKPVLLALGEVPTWEGLPAPAPAPAPREPRQKAAAKRGGGKKREAAPKGERARGRAARGGSRRAGAASGARSSGRAGTTGRTGRARATSGGERTSRGSASQADQDRTRRRTRRGEKTEE